MMSYEDEYLPIDPDFLEVIEAAKKNNKSGKVHFFNPKGEVDDANGHILNIIRNEYGQFIQLSDASNLRLDKIITLFGRPGPAYAQYDSYANACLTCEDLGQFY